MKRDGAIAAVSPPEIEDNDIVSERQARYAQRALLQEEHQQPHIEEEEENDTSHDDSPHNTQTETVPSNSSSTRQNKFSAFSSKVAFYSDTYRKLFKDLKLGLSCHVLMNVLITLLPAVLTKRKLRKKVLGT